MCYFVICGGFSLDILYLLLADIRSLFVIRDCSRDVNDRCLSLNVDVQRGACICICFFCAFRGFNRSSMCIVNLYLCGVYFWSVCT